MSKYFEVKVVFITEVETKTGVKEKKIGEIYLVEAETPTYAEAKVNEKFQDSQWHFETTVVKESKILGVF